MLTCFTGNLTAKKFKFSFNDGKTKKPALMASFITNTNNANNATAISNNVTPGQTIYFYYKIGPISAVKGKGAPFKTNLVVTKGSKKIKDFGWNDANAVGQDKMNITANYGWYHSAGWNLNISDKIKPGTYNAIITHKDKNSKTTITIRYTFTVS